MPIRFMSDPLGVAILAGNEGFGIIVLAKPTALRARPPTLGPSMIAQMEAMELVSTSKLGRAAYERCRHLEGLELVEREGGGWALTQRGRDWLVEHRRENLGREHHRRRHDAAVVEVIRSGVPRVRHIAMQVGLTRDEVWHVLRRLERTGEVEKAVSGWRIPGPRTRRAASSSKEPAGARAGW